MQEETKLLCTFTNEAEYQSIVDEIRNKYEGTNQYNKIFVLKLLDSDHFIVTYNISLKEANIPFLEDTIPINRKKSTNTLYTMDAYKVLKMPINWQKYKYCFLNKESGELRVHKTEKICELNFKIIA